MRRLAIPGLFALALAWVGVMDLLRGGRARASFPDGGIHLDLRRLEVNEREVSLSLKVSGQDGKVLAGLTEKDFEVAEEGEPIPLKRFTAAGRQPLCIFLALDHSGSMMGKRIEGVRQAALALLDLLGDDDHLGLSFFQSTIREVLPLGPLDARRREQARKEIAELRADGGTQLFAAMKQALAAMKEVSGRRVLLVLTDGIDDSREPGQNTFDDRMKGILEAARRQGVPLYMVGIGPRRALDEYGMKRFAEETRGEYVYADQADQLAEIYRGIVGQLRNEYAFVFDVPRAVHDGTARLATVAVRWGDIGGKLEARYEMVKGAEDGGSASFGQVWWPLALGLGLLFGVPYLMVSWPRAGHAKAMPVPVIVQVVPTVVPTAVTVPQPTSVRPAVMAQPPGDDVCPRCRRKAPGRFCLACGQAF